MVEDEAQETGAEQETVTPDGAGRPVGQPPQGSGWPHRTQPDYMEVLREVTKTLPEAAGSEGIGFAQLLGGMQPADLQQLLQKLDGVSKDQAYVISQKYQLAMWRALQQAAPEGLRFSLPGMAGSQSQTPWPGFGPSLTGGYPNPYPYAPTYYSGPPPPPAATEAAPSPQFAALKEEIGQMVNSVAEQMAALQQRLDQQEAERQRAEKERKRKEEIDRLVTEHKEEIKRQQETYTAQLQALEAKLAPQKAPGEDTEVAALRKELADLAKSLHDQQIGALQAQLEELKKREPTSPTELGVIQHTADKVVEAAQDAGEGIQSLVLGMQKSAAFPAGRRSPQKRATAGEELVKRASKNTALLGDMDKLFAGDA